jgi:glycosyltransferase involved in cell wall biosynthesis
MSTYNGEMYLQEQLDSIYNQTGVTVCLSVRDDGSDDSTRTILGKNNLELLPRVGDGGNLGPAKSFLHLIKSVTCDEYVAIADQDDIWHPHKMSKAIMALEKFEHLPALYCSNVKLYSEHKLDDPNSALPAPMLPLSIFQNSAMGCTIVLNNRAHQIIQRSSGTGMVMHDWYILLVILSVGKVIFDPSESMLYRLHANQAIGWKRKRNFRRVFSLKNLLPPLRQAEGVYREFYDQIPPHSREIFETILDISKVPLGRKIVLLFGGRLTLRQNMLESTWTKIRLLAVSQN